MPILPTDLRNKLERACIAARNIAEPAARDALKSLAVAHHEPYGHMTPEQRALRNKLWARAKQLGDTADARGQRSIEHLAQECAYEHWHRMLFARFLAENNLLIEPEMRVAVSLEECKELAKEAKVNLWAMAGRFAQTMLPEIFRVDDPVLQVPLAREDQLKLEEQLNGLAPATFTASDALGWCYQFWQSERKDQVNAAGNKIGADELPSVTQLFTEDYMVDFLLDNTLGAWWAGKALATKEHEAWKTEAEVRRASGLPSMEWKYLRFIKGEDGKWTPAAGEFEGWPKTAKELKCLDPCMGSGHFVVAMFERLVALRMAEEKLDEKSAVAVAIRDNLFGLELDARCTQIAAFNLALAAWRRVGHCVLPAMHLACSGLAPNAREADWLKLAGDSDKLQRGMARLYRLFQNAPVLGSLINPRASGGDLVEAGFQELSPLLAKALEAEQGRLRESAGDTTDLEMAVTAQGITKAAEILAGQFTLVATNVPYLGRGKQDEVLMDYCERVHPQAKADLATCFVERCLDFCIPSGSTVLVTPQNWLFLGTYKKLRQGLLKDVQWDAVARLGERAFDSSQAAGAFVALLGFTRGKPLPCHAFVGVDAAEQSRPEAKATQLREGEFSRVLQLGQMENPDGRIVLEGGTAGPRLSDFADSFGGLGTGDFPHYGRCYWEFPTAVAGWAFQQVSVYRTLDYGGRECVVAWDFSIERVRGMDLAEREQIHNQDQSGQQAWGKKGVAIALMRELKATLYTGERYEKALTVLIPKNPDHLLAIWACCTAPDFNEQVRKLDQKVIVANATVAKIPFDITHWQNVAAEKYPQGLPKPFSSDPTQWLFNGHPHGSDHPLQVAVARALGYRWPRQTGSSFPDCPALDGDGLEKFADDDGIVCIPSVRGEEPAAERLRKLLSAAYGEKWKSTTELELIHATGSGAGDFEEWLRDDFFEQHCSVFHQRPFIWHIWDGRKRDGFHALVNYHVLAGADGKGRRTLENLTHSYLGDWITRQKDGIKRGEEGAEERLAAALALKERLEAILTGDPPFDLFVRWKLLAQQAIGWEPDINDGVRMNIRPFLASDVPGGKRGAGVLRVKPGIKWDKDRGKEPLRDRLEFPWFWNGVGLTGDRVNDVHLPKEQKERARGFK